MGVNGGGVAVADETGTYLNVLEALARPDRFVALLDPNLILEARGTDDLWTATSYDQLVRRIPRAHEAGVRVEINDCHFVRGRMLLVLRVRVPPMVEQHDGPRDGQTVYRVMTLRAGRIVRIQHCPNRGDAMAELLDASYSSPQTFCSVDLRRSTPPRRDAVYPTPVGPSEG